MNFSYMRKVRASHGRVTANGSRGKPKGKCNREIPPNFFGKGGKAR